MREVKPMGFEMLRNESMMHEMNGGRERFQVVGATIWNERKRNERLVRGAGACKLAEEDDRNKQQENKD